jgi:hypothetical protein
LKRTRKKYGLQVSGELMLVHVCVGCGKVSLNRIAADDDTDKAWEIFARPPIRDGQILAQVRQSGIQALDLSAFDLVRAQLFGLKVSTSP